VLSVRVLDTPDALGQFQNRHVQVVATESSGVLLLMFPTHAAVGYLAGTYSRYPLALLALGSVLPDLVDRPLFWLGLASHSHTVGHSALLAVPVSVLAVALVGSRGIALAVGWLGHLAGDMLNVATTAGPAHAPTFVLFPLVDPEGGQTLTTFVFSPPLLATPHIVHPAVLAAEVVVLAWALAVGVRAAWRRPATE
jgi:hypothetical protein